MKNNKLPTPKQRKAAQNYIKYITGEAQGMKGTKGELLIQSGYSKLSATQPHKLLNNNPAIIEVEENFRKQQQTAMDSFSEIMLKAIDDIKQRDFSQDPLISVASILKLTAEFMEKQSIKESDNEPFCLPSEIVDKYKLNDDINKS